MNKTAVTAHCISEEKSLTAPVLETSNMDKIFKMVAF